MYHILDVFLLQGIDTLFQVALALLSRSRKDLLQHDFEGVLKYFRYDFLNYEIPSYRHFIYILDA